MALVFGSYSLALAQTYPTVPSTPTVPTPPTPPSTPSSLYQQQKTTATSNASAASGTGGNASVNSGTVNANAGGATAASGISSITTGPSAITSIQPRSFPIPETAGFGYIPSYFGPATADVNWQTMRTLTTFKLDWSASDAQALLEGVKPGFVGKMFKHPLKSRPKCFYGTMSDHPVGGVLRVAVNGNNVKEIKDMTLIGTNDVWANNVETTTQEVLGQAIYDGLCMNADVLLVTGEGAAVVLRAFGWGVGINNSVSVMSGGIGNAGNVAAAGFGVSGVEAGYRSKPWLQVLYFKSVAAIAPPPPAVAPPPPPSSKPKS